MSELSKEELKGQLGGNCNRTSCQAPHAYWYNHSTQKYYCTNCAMTLNECNPEGQELFGHELCTFDKKDLRMAYRTADGLALELILIISKINH